VVGTATLVGVLFLLVATSALHGGAYQEQLRRECDALIAAAVKRTYGWGWDTTAPAAAGRNTPRHVTMEPLGTPAAGLLLVWAGDFLSEPKYKDAALQAAKGIADAQAQSGQVPMHPIFSASSAGGRDPTSPVPDRTATVAALALFLAVDRDDQIKSEPLVRATRLASFWLIKQAAEDGGWPSSYIPDPEDRQKLRIIRLDNSDYRDCTFAMLLAADVLDDPQIIALRNKTVQKLVSLRLGTRLSDVPAAQMNFAPRAAELWSTAYRLDGSIDSKLEEFPLAADVVASRFAMQTLLGAYLMLGEKQVGLVMDSAHQAMGELRDSKGLWKRAYILAPTTAPATTQSTSPFAPDAVGPWTTGTYDLPPTLESIQQLKLMGRQKYLTMLEVHFSARQHLAACVCGLTDQPGTLDLPVTKPELEQYLKQHGEQFGALISPPPDELTARVKRLWLLLVRAKLEKMAERS
jgi:hypothetical protein